MILADGAQIDISLINTYERILNIFDGNNDLALERAREYWKKIKTSDNELHYWQQNNNGVLNKKHNKYILIFWEKRQKKLAFFKMHVRCYRCKVLI